MGLAGSLAGSGYGGALAGTALHKFDTGLHRAQRTEIRQALIERITGALGKVEGGYLRAVVSIPRPLKNDSAEEIGLIYDRVQGQQPCVAIALGRKEYQADGMDIPAVNFRGYIDLAIYAISGNLRERVDGRLATDVSGAADVTADPGVDIILEHLEEVLLGQELDLKTVYELRPVSEDELATFADVAIWEQRYLIGVDRSIDPDRDNEDVLMSIEAKNNLTDADDENPLVETVSDVEIE